MIPQVQTDLVIFVFQIFSPDYWHSNTFFSLFVVRSKCTNDGFSFQTQLKKYLEVKMIPKLPKDLINAENIKRRGKLEVFRILLSVFFNLLLFLPTLPSVSYVLAI